MTKLWFTDGKVEWQTVLSRAGDLSLGSLASQFDFDPMTVSMDSISLPYNPSTGESVGFTDLLNELREKDAEAGSSKEKAIQIVGKPAGEWA
jgi:hypothetical protein